MRGTTRVQVPTLNVTGWYDTMLQPAIDNYMGMVRYRPAALRRSLACSIVAADEE